MKLSRELKLSFQNISFNFREYGQRVANDYLPFDLFCSFFAQTPKRGGNLSIICVINFWATGMFVDFIFLFYLAGPALVR